MKRGTVARIVIIIAAAFVTMTIGTGQAAAAVAKMSHAQAVAKFTEYGMDIWSSGNCTDRNNPNCTSFEQINTETVRGAITLTTYSGCHLTLTGGTETGHGDGTYTHWNGYKLDMSLTSCLADYVSSNFAYIGGSRWQSPAGNVYYKEPDHWDVLFYNCGGCDGTESTMARG